MNNSSGASPNPTTEIRDLKVGYDQTSILGPITCDITTGITALLGRNGAGKTTLMRTLCGIVPAIGGSFRILGESSLDGAAIKGKVGYLGHQSALAKALTVSQNLSFWRHITSSYPEIQLASEAELVDQFELQDLLHRKTGSLSQGQKQRVDLARLAMTNPQFIILDEPFSGLDPIHADSLRHTLTEWSQTRSVIYSTHSIPEATALAERFLVVHDKRLTPLHSHHAESTSQEILSLLGATQ